MKKMLRILIGFLLLGAVCGLCSLKISELMRVDGFVGMFGNALMTSVLIVLGSHLALNNSQPPTP